MEAPRNNWVDDGALDQKPVVEETPVAPEPIPEPVVETPVEVAPEEPKQ